MISSGLITRPFMAVAGGALAYNLAAGLTLPVTPRYVVGPLGGNEAAAGVAIGAFAVSALVFRLWAGRLADRRGRRPLLLAGGALFAAALVGHLVAGSLPVLVLMRVLMGVAEAMIFVAGLTAVSDIAPPDRRGEAVSYFSLSIYLGIALGPMIGEALLGSDRFALVWVSGAVLAAVAAAIWLTVPETRPEPSGDTPAAVTGWRSIVHPAAFRPGLVAFTGAFGFAGFLAFAALHADALGMAGAAPVFFLFAGIVIAVRFFGSRIPDRIGARPAGMTALSVSAVGLAIIASWAQPVGLYVGAAVFAVGISLGLPAMALLVLADAPAAARGVVLGTYSAFIDLAFGLGPLVLGAVAAAAGFRAAFIVAAASALIGLGYLAASGLGATRAKAVAT